MRKMTKLAALAMALMVTPALGEDFPSRNIDLIFPWTPNASMAANQILAEAVGEELGVSIPVISTPGAAGTKAYMTAMGRPADGYTIMDAWVAPLVLQPVLGKADWTYKDAVPLHAGVSNAFSIGIKSGDERFSNLQELMEYGKAHPGELRYSSGSRNNLPHMVIARVLQSYGVVAQNIPFGSDADAFQNLKSGEIDFSYVNVNNWQQDKEAVDVVLVMSDLDESSEAYGGAPNFNDFDRDFGLSGLASMGWDWWVISPDVPQEKVDVLRKAMVAAVTKDETKEKIRALGYVPLQWDYDQYDEIVGPVQEQLGKMAEALAWEQEQLKKLN